MAGFCRNCGSPLDDGQGFCARCGTPASGPPVGSTPPSSSASSGAPLHQRPSSRLLRHGPPAPAPAARAAAAAPARSGSTLVKVLLDLSGRNLRFWRRRSRRHLVCRASSKACGSMKSALDDIVHGMRTPIARPALARPRSVQTSFESRRRVRAANAEVIRAEADPKAVNPDAFLQRPGRGVRSGGQTCPPCSTEKAPPRLSANSLSRS